MPPSSSNSHSRRSNSTKDKRMEISQLLYNSSSRQSSSHHSHHHHQSTAPSSYNFHHEQNSKSSMSFSQLHPPPSDSDASSTITTARRDFVIAITRPSTKRGYLECRLCDGEVWGPNGRYHLDKCPVLLEARDTARKHGVRLTTVGGFTVHPDVFRSSRRPEPKPAKIPGFVMSHSVSVNNPNQALTEEELDAGMQRGRKGYVRCLRCNSEVFAPNARNHASHCRRRSNGAH